MERWNVRQHLLVVADEFIGSCTKPLVQFKVHYYYYTNIMCLLIDG